MNCINCFNEIEASAKVCPLCGYNLESYTPAPYHLPLFTEIGERFIVGRVIGEGGFGITYKACDTVLGAKYAVKEYYPAEISGRGGKSEDGNTIFPFAGEEKNFADGLERFEKEARRMTEFDGLAGIVNVKDYFSENGTGYIVMEYAEGTSLESYLESKGGHIPLSEAMKLVKPVILSLGRVHSKGIIHRDISPDNIMLTEKNGAVLIDFGSARQFDSEKSLSVIIKYGYAPYEQYGRHGKQGPWTDVYAMSGVIYRMVTGERPPDAIARVQGEADLLEMKRFDPSVTQAQEMAIKTGLEAKAANRLKSMEQLYEALYNGNFDFPDDDSFAESKPAVRKKHKAAAIIIAAAVVVFAAGSLIFSNTFNAISEMLAGTVTVPDLSGLSADEAQQLLTSMDIPFSFSSGEDGSSPKGAVLSQQPLAGAEIKADDTVIVTVNILDTVSVPLLTDMSVDDAEKLLTELGLTVQKETVENYEYADSTVVGQSRPDGSYTVKGNEITITVNKLPQPLAASAPIRENFKVYLPSFNTGIPDVCDIDAILAGRREDMLKYSEEEYETQIYDRKAMIHSAEYAESNFDYSFGKPGENAAYTYIEDDFDYDGRNEYYFCISEILYKPVSEEAVNTQLPEEVYKSIYDFYDVIDVISIYYIDNNGDYSMVFGSVEDTYFYDSLCSNSSEAEEIINECLNEVRDNVSSNESFLLDGYELGHIDGASTPLILDYDDCKHLFLPSLWGNCLGDIFWQNKHIQAGSSAFGRNDSIFEDAMAVTNYKYDLEFNTNTYYPSRQEIEDYILNDFTAPSETNYTDEQMDVLNEAAECYIWNGSVYEHFVPADGIKNESVPWEERPIIS